MSSHIYNAKYKAEVAKYGKKDAVIAICFFVYICALLFFADAIAAWVVIGLDIAGTRTGAIVYVLAIALPMVVPVIAIILIRGQGLSSVGIHRKQLGAALGLGLVFSAIAIILLYIGLLPGFIQGGQLLPFGIIMFWLLYTVILAAWEDIAFTGFIQPRLYGLIKHDILAVFTGGMMFAIMHIPFRLATVGPAAFNAYLLLEVAGWIGLHSIYNLVFRRYFSIFPVILLHTFINFSHGGRLWEHPRPAGLDETISFIVIVLAVGTWAFYLRRKGAAAKS